MQRTLISARELLDWPRARPLVPVDCRFDLADVARGERAYADAHLPGAVYAHLERDLSGPVTPLTGRHPLPDATVLAAKCGALGIDGDVQVVAYDDAGGAFAARLWWLLRWLGHEAVAVLDGGLRAWREAGGPLSREVPRPTPRQFVARRDDSRSVDAARLALALDAGRCVLIDARAAERFAGEVEPIDPIAGHVPGARCAPFAANLGPDGLFLPAADLRARYGALLGARAPGELVAMCGSGVTACHDLLALEIAGLPGARLYAGSWSEWIRDPARPVARGRD
jgi:thiosulfate/3-mercaptopyruvate sulfurtransferase